MSAKATSGVEVVSLGCRMNLAESERMQAMLAQEGDLVVINSCAVTAEALRQTRQAIRRARRNRPDARLLVTGCAAEIEREAIAAMPEVDGLIANAEKLDARAWNVPDLALWRRGRWAYAGLCRGPERLRSRLHLLHHPAGARPLRVHG
jgi:threonylcarbamoyladenosine tRNA methylthiotransferase MtaB